MACFIFYNKRNLERLQGRKNQYVVVENPNTTSPLELESFTRLGEEKQTSIAINSLYQTTIEFTPGLHDSTVIPGSPGSDEIYSEVKNVNGKERSESEQVDTSSSLYDIPEDQYAQIPEVYTDTTPTHQVQNTKQDVDLSPDDQETSEALPEKKPNYTLIHKPSPPPVPDKNSELKQYLDLKVKAEEAQNQQQEQKGQPYGCLLYTSPSPRDATLSRMPSSA